MDNTLEHMDHAEDHSFPDDGQLDAGHEHEQEHEQEQDNHDNIDHENENHENNVNEENENYDNNDTSNNAHSYHNKQQNSYNGQNNNNNNNRRRNNGNNNNNNNSRGRGGHRGGARGGCTNNHHNNHHNNNIPIQHIHNPHIPSTHHHINTITPIHYPSTMHSHHNGHNSTNNNNNGSNQAANNAYQVKELTYNYTRILKVSSKSNPKNVAGSISHTSRGGDSPTLMATGAVSMNQAIKAIAIARGYLEDNSLDIQVKCEFRNEERGAVSFILNKTTLRRNNAGGNNNNNNAANEGPEMQELRVAQQSEPSVVAGSIAKKVRAGERVCVVSIGAGSVSQTVRAITIARRYLEKDNVDISFRPEFVHVDMKDGQRSAIRFQILSQQV